MTQTQEPVTVPEDLPDVIYWHDNQVALTLLSDLPVSAGPTKIIQSLHLDQLNNFLNTKGFNLTSFGESDVPHPRTPDRDKEADEKSVVQEGMKAHDEDGDDDGDDKGLESPVGKYLFGSDQNTFVISFFNVARTNGDKKDATVEAVNLLNDPKTKAILDRQGVSDYTAMPNWLNGGANGKPKRKGTQGCPVNPPYPVTRIFESGRCPITLQELYPPVLQEARGAGVRVIILDTLPGVEQIRLAYEGAGNHNLLLGDLYVNMVSTPPFNAQLPAINVHYLQLPDTLDKLVVGLPTAGEDIYERLVGYPMVDHGLFIAGIVRDLAPGAQIECIRVLNDEAVGDAATLTHTLLDILRRMEKGNDLFNTPLVINLSLTETPLDEELINLGFTSDPQLLEDTRAGLVVPFKFLADRGVIFTASAGNDSSPTNPTNVTKCRHWPHYPAAFAYYKPEPVRTMIPVGAVEMSEKAASYSHFPGPFGIATYSGRLLKAREPLSEPHTVTHIEEPIDALCGVFSSRYYPALSKDDQLPNHAPPPVDYPVYPAPNSDAWAYWMGTSFATPIISAVVARILEPGKGSMPANNVRQAVIDAADGHQTLWTRLHPGANGMCDSDECTSEDNCAYGPLIMAFQECQSE